MVIPYLGRIRRRRHLIIVVAFVVLLTFYMAYKYPDQPPSQFVPAKSPEDEAKPVPPQTVKMPPIKEPPLEDKPASAGKLEQKKQKPPQPPANKEPEGERGKPVEEKQKAAESENDAEELKNAGEEEDDEIARRAKLKATLSVDDLLQMPLDAMAYGTTARPPVKGLTNIVAEQPVELVAAGSGAAALPPSLLGQPDGVLRRRRFVFVGDVHGQRVPLEQLLAKIGFAPGRDHLILTGDMTNKGPDSAGVVQLAMELGASAVRGNHDDRVLLAYEALHRAEPGIQHAPAAVAGAKADRTPKEGDEAIPERTLAAIEAEGKRERARAMREREEARKNDEEGGSKGLLSFLGLQTEKKKSEEDDASNEASNDKDSGVDPLEQNPFSHGDAVERATAASLTPEQARWLAERPVILHLGRIASPPLGSGSASAVDHPFQDVVVVHAGLVPGLPLDRQDPHAAMTMRSFVRPRDEARRERARDVAEKKLIAQSRGRLHPGDAVAVPRGRVEAEFRELQRATFGPADSRHPHQPGSLGPHPRTVASSESGGGGGGAGHPQPADFVLLPIEGHASQGGAQSGDRVPWWAAWNQAQHAFADPANRTTVVYGHDAVTGLNVPPGLAAASLGGGLLSSLFGGIDSSASSGWTAAEDTGYTFGLDSGAVYGGKLTALVVEADREGRVVHRLEQVACPPHAKLKGG